MKKNERPKVLLVAEDDVDHYLLLKEAFEKLGPMTELRHVLDGEELTDYLFRQGKFQDPGDSPRPDLILLDLNMPRKDGREALKEIKSDPVLRRIPVIILTTSRAEEDVLQSYELGANSFLRKPLGFNQWVELAQTFGQYWFHTVELPRHAADEIDETTTP